MLIRKDREISNLKEQIVVLETSTQKMVTSVMNEEKKSLHLCEALAMTKSVNKELELEIVRLRGESGEKGKRAEKDATNMVETQDKTRQDKTRQDYLFPINRNLQRPIYTVGQAVGHIYRYL